MKEYNVNPNLVKIIHSNFPKMGIEIDEKLLFHGKNVKQMVLIQYGIKETIIRYAKGKIIIPASNQISFYESREDEFERGKYDIDKITVKFIEELTEEDAKNDRFSGKAEFIKELEEIYGPIDKCELVSIYHFKRQEKKLWVTSLI